VKSGIILPNCRFWLLLFLRGWQCFGNARSPLHFEVTAETTGALDKRWPREGQTDEQPSEIVGLIRGYLKLILDNSYSGPYWTQLNKIMKSKKRASEKRLQAEQTKRGMIKDVCFNDARPLGADAGTPMHEII
jgi:hypothetical protein